MDTPGKSHNEIIFDEIFWGQSSIFNKKNCFANSSLNYEKDYLNSYKEENDNIIINDSYSNNLNKRTLSNDDINYEIIELDNLDTKDKFNFPIGKDSLFDIKSDEDCEDLSTIISKLSYNNLSTKSNYEIFKKLKENKDNSYNTSEDIKEDKKNIENTLLVNEDISSLIKTNNSIFNYNNLTNDNKELKLNKVISNDVKKSCVNDMQATNTIPSANITIKTTSTNINIYNNINRSCNSNKAKKINMKGRVLINNESPLSVNLALNSDKNLTNTINPCKKSSNTLTGLNKHRIERVSCIFK